MPRRILIADDSPLTRKTLQDLLQTHGWEVYGQAENGLDAVRMAVELNPDVVILDLAMPSMDGLTAAGHISASLPTIPIVMHTLHSLPQLELEAKKNGVRCIVPKSESAHIITILNELISPRGSGGSGGSLQAVAERESATTEPTSVPVTEGTVPKIQASEPASRTDRPDDIVKAS
jgi:two-component system chemotaxis response regulator CheY